MSVLPASIVSPPSPTRTSKCNITKGGVDELFDDEFPDDEELPFLAQAQAQPQASARAVSMSLADWLAQRSATEGPMTCAQAARLAVSVLEEADAAVAKLGSAALLAVQCDCVRLDAGLAAHLQLQSEVVVEGKRECLNWLSPEEAIGCVGEQVVWAALSYRLGLLLHCAAVSGSPDPYPDRSADVVAYGLLRAAKACGEPEVPFHGFSHSNSPSGSASSCRLMQNVISSCLRISRRGAPDRRVVETSLALLAREDKL
jgi:hypothetical protein